MSVQKVETQNFEKIFEKLQILPGILGISWVFEEISGTKLSLV
jgi:hypothetical protein